MAIKPKTIIDTAVSLGREAVDRGVGLAERLRKDETDSPPATPATRTTPERARATSGDPSTVGAAKPGEPRGPKSASTPKTAKSKPAAAKSKPAAAKSKPAAAKSKPAAAKSKPAAAKPKPAATKPKAPGATKG
jgi:sec-independent protein translocase protein TatB